MTTIAYAEGVIAYDSRMCRGNLIGDDDHDKRITLKDHHFFLAGSVEDIQRFVHEVVDEKFTLVFDCCGLMVTPDGTLYAVGSNDNEHWRVRWDPAKPVAYGSGQDFAYSAMDFGKTAKQAVKYAMTRDSNTGGKVRTFKLTK